MIMYYNKKEKLFIDEDEYKGQSGYVEVDATLQNIYNAFARSRYDITVENTTYHCVRYSFSCYYFIQEQEYFYYNKKMKLFVEADNVRMTILGDYYSGNQYKLNVFNDVKFKNGRFYIKKYKKYKYQNLRDLIIYFYNKKYPKYITVGYHGDIKGIIISHIFRASEFKIMRGYIERIDNDHLVFYYKKKKYYCERVVEDYHTEPYWAIIKEEK